jgi:hypothetical protein
MRLKTLLRRRKALVVQLDKGTNKNWKEEKLCFRKMAWVTLRRLENLAWELLLEMLDLSIRLKSARQKKSKEH